MVKPEMSDLEKATARLSKIFKLYTKSKTGFDDPSNIQLGSAHLIGWIAADLFELYGPKVLVSMLWEAGCGLDDHGGKEVDVNQAIEELKEEVSLRQDARKL